MNRLGSPLSQWMTTEEAAAFITANGYDVSTRTLVRWRRKRRKRYKKSGPPYRRKSDRIYYHKDAVLQWIEEVNRYGTPQVLEKSDKSKRKPCLIQLHMTPEQLQFFNDRAALIGRPRAAIIRDALDMYIEDTNFG